MMFGNTKKAHENKARREQYISYLGLDKPHYWELTWGKYPMCPADEGLIWLFPATKEEVLESDFRLFDLDEEKRDEIPWDSFFSLKALKADIGKYGCFLKDGAYNSDLKKGRAHFMWRLVLDAHLEATVDLTYEMRHFLEHLSHDSVGWDEVEFAAFHRGFKLNPEWDFIRQKWLTLETNEELTHAAHEFIDRALNTGGGFPHYPLSAVPYLMTGCPERFGEGYPYPAWSYLVGPQSEVAS